MENLTAEQIEKKINIKRIFSSERPRMCNKSLVDTVEELERKVKALKTPDGRSDLSISILGFEILEEELYEPICLYWKIHHSFS